MKAFALCVTVALVASVVAAGRASTAAPAASAEPSMSLPDNWSANFTASNGQFNYTGYYIYDLDAKRSYRRVHELNQSTFVFQDFGNPILYTYNIGSSGCTCSTHKNGFIPSFWSTFPATTKKGTCSGGSLYGMNPITKGLPGVPTSSFCISSAGVPVWREEDGPGSRYTFTNFQAGVTDFPFDEFNGWVTSCANSCI